MRAHGGAGANPAVDFSLAFTTTATRETAVQIAQEMLRVRLAACVQIAEIDSHYVWQGKVEQAREFQLQFKIRTQDFDALCAALSAVHPYEVPEILHVPISAVAPAYRAWLQEMTGPVRES